jgi:hypothetical protein
LILGQSGGATKLEDLAVDKMTFRVEVVVNAAVNGGQLLQTIIFWL